jgi:hypothetical protein
MVRKEFRNFCPMKTRLMMVCASVFLLVLAGSIALSQRREKHPAPALTEPSVIAKPEQDALQMIKEGRQTFRFDTFGDEAFWGNNLKLHRAIAGQKLGGVGRGVSPRMALQVGLKVDQDALPASLVRKIQRNKVNLDDPATTLILLKRNAVIGLKGFFTKKGKLRSIGTTCAICHSTVDDSLTSGIGHRLDGWPNRDLNIGKIITLAPNLTFYTDRLQVTQDQLKRVFLSWGPGKFDAELLHDGKAFRPDGKPAATLIPPAFGKAGVNSHTYTGWGSVPHWNAYVAVTQMRGKGTFFDPRLKNAKKFPIAARLGEWTIRNDPDLVTAKLPALHVYQLSLLAPKPPAGSFDAAAAARGKLLFNGKATCSRCHVAPLFSEPGWPMHKPAEIGIDGFQAQRSPTGRYRTTPLKGLWTHMKGGFYHDGRFATLQAVIDHYNAHFNLGLSEGEVKNLTEYLKSL